MKCHDLYYVLLIFLCFQTYSDLRAAEADKKQRLNVLFVLADDQRPDTIGAFGNNQIKTPNLDKLAKQGFRFSRTYCMGSMGGAVCVPSRAMLNSGRGIFHVRTNLSDAKTMPQIFREAGYTTFGTGKWHNGRPSFLKSFSKGRSVFFGGMSNHIKVPLNDTDDQGKVFNKRTGKGFSNTLFVDAAIGFLKTQPNDKPFYAYVSMTASHDPRQAPKEFMKLYSPEKMQLPKNFMPQHPFNNGWLVLRDENLAPWPRTKIVIQHQTAEYYALISHMDYELGRLFKTLKETGKDKNTIIVYAADHGLALGSHGLLGKQSLYEHSMGTPLIFCGPGIPQGKSSDAFAYLFDIFPTVSQLIEVDTPEEIDGKSLAPIISGQKKSVRDTVFTVFSKQMRAVRDDRWKLIRYPKINKNQLFDLKNDPDEMKNLANDPQHEQQTKKMMALLKNHQSNWGDKLPLTASKLSPEKRDLTGIARKPDRHQPKWIVDKYFKMKGWPKE